MAALFCAVVEIRKWVRLPLTSDYSDNALYCDVLTVRDKMTV